MRGSGRLSRSTATSGSGCVVMARERGCICHRVVCTRKSKIHRLPRAQLLRDALLTASSALCSKVAAGRTSINSAHKTQHSHAANTACKAALGCSRHGAPGIAAPEGLDRAERGVHAGCPIFSARSRHVLQDGASSSLRAAAPGSHDLRSVSVRNDERAAAPRLCLLQVLCHKRQGLR